MSSPRQSSADAVANGRKPSASVASGTAWNLVGIAVPVVVGIYAVPRIITALGTERFGILTLAWTMAGYFSIFDLGIGRALTHAVAQKVDVERDEELASTVCTGVALMVGLGAIALIAVAGCSGPIVAMMNVSPAIRAEARTAVVLLAAAIPFTTTAAGLRGIVEGVQRFAGVNVVRAALGAATVAGPLVALAFSSSLVAVMVVLLASRIAVTAAYGGLAVHHLPALRTAPSLSWRGIGPLLRFGGWTTVSNVVGPILSNADRFLIASLASAAAVAYYSTSYEIVSKLLVLPAALIAVLFPAFTASIQANRAAVAAAYGRATRWTFVLLFPVTLALVVLAEPLLTVWLGREFAAHSTRPLQLMAAGVLFNALAYLPAVLVQAAGRPDVPAKLNMAELVVYFPALLYVLPRWGVDGAAALWALRVFVDAMLLFGAARRLLGERDRWRAAATASICGGLAVLGGVLVADPSAARWTLLTVAVAAWIAASWRYVLDEVDRGQLATRVLGVFSR